MRKRALISCCFAVLAACEEAGTASQPAPAPAASAVKTEAAKPAPGFARDAFKPSTTPIEGEPVDQARLIQLLPEQLDGYVADAPVVARRVNVPNGGALTTVKRTYKKDASSLELEIIDSLHSPNIRSIVKLSAQVEANTPSVVRKPEKVGEHLAIAQWHQATHMARIGVLVNDRFIVNVNVGPTGSPDLGLELARKLDLTPLVTLAAEVALEAKTKAAAPGAAVEPATAPVPATATATAPAPTQGASKPR
jgi:hypothetical protein